MLCSGKVYYDLLAERENQGIDNVSIVRMEQIYPFPHKTLKALFKKRPQAAVIWCQEEPRNMGSWFFVRERLEQVMADCGCSHTAPQYVGRPEAASPATGSLSRHMSEQQKLVREALDLNHQASNKAAE